VLVAGHFGRGSLIIHVKWNQNQNIKLAIESAAMLTSSDQWRRVAGWRSRARPLFGAAALLLLVGAAVSSTRQPASPLTLSGHELWASFNRGSEPDQAAGGAATPYASGPTSYRDFSPLWDSFTPGSEGAAPDTDGPSTYRDFRPVFKKTVKAAGDAFADAIFNQTVQYAGDAFSDAGESMGGATLAMRKKTQLYYANAKHETLHLAIKLNPESETTTKCSDVSDCVRSPSAALLAAPSLALTLLSVKCRQSRGEKSVQFCCRTQSSCSSAPPNAPRNPPSQPSPAHPRIRPARL